MIKRMWSAARRQDGGAAAVEMAIVCPLFVALIAGVIDLGLMLYQRTVVGTAADAGTIEAIIDAGNAGNPAVPISLPYKTAIQNAVTNSYSIAHGFATAVQATPAPSTFCGCPAANLSITGAVCGATCPGTNCAGALCPAGTYVTVNAQSNYTPVFPLTGLPRFFSMSAAAVPLNATSTVRIQ